MKKVFLGIAVASVIAAQAGTAQAATINVSSVAGQTYVTAGLTQFSTDGDDMSGMQITAVINNVAYVGSWVNTGGANDDGGAVVWTTFPGGDDPGLSISGDTFNSQWQLDFSITGSNNSLQSLTFNGVPGRTVFDRTNPSLGTPGSDQGNDFNGFCQVGLFNSCSQSAVPGTITAVYTNQVRLTNAIAVGDLFAQFSMSFSQALDEGAYRFVLDTDNATTELLQGNPNPQVPEPTTLVLLGASLIGVATRLRRRS